MYTLAMAKNDYKESWITGFSLLRINTKKGSCASMMTETTGWIIEVWKDSPEGTKRQICTARGETRIFKTLDAAIQVVEEIGFSADYLTA